MPYPPASIQNIQLELQPFIHGNIKRQTVAVYINNRLLTTYELDGNKVITIPIPISIPHKANSEEFLDIRLDIPTAVSPKSIGMGDDERKLGVGVIKITNQYR